MPRPRPSRCAVPARHASISNLHKIRVSLESSPRLDSHNAARRVREMLLGPPRGNPAMRDLEERLRAPDFRHWYPPSKYLLQDFRVDQYLAMQAERFAPPPASPAIQMLLKTAVKLQQKEKRLESVLERCTARDFWQNPTLRHVFELRQFLKTRAEVNLQPPAAGSLETQQQPSSTVNLRCSEAFNFLSELIFKQVPLEHKIGSLKRYAQQPTVIHSIATAAAPLRDEAALAGRDSPASAHDLRTQAASSKRAPAAENDADDDDEEEVDTDAQQGAPIRWIVPKTLNQSLPEGGPAEAVQRLEYSAQLYAFVEELQRRAASEATKKLRGEPATMDTEEAVDGKEDSATTRPTTTKPKAKHAAPQALLTRHRFVDPLYNKKRHHYLLTRSKRSCPPRKALLLKHYSVHPDQLICYPSRKGPTFLRYPSVR